MTKTSKKCLLIGIVFISFSFFVAMILNGYIISSFSGIRKSESFFAVCQTSDSALTSATISSEIKTRGGAGYVIKDQNKFLIILNVYQKKSDAEKVMKNQTLDNLMVKEIKTKELKSTSNSTQTKEFLAYNLNLLKRFIDYSLKLDKSEISYAELHQKILDEYYFVKKNSEEFADVKYSYEESFAEEIALEFFKIEITLKNFSLSLNAQAHSEVKILICMLLEILK